MTAEQEAEAQRLAHRLQEEARADLLALARSLVSKQQSEISGSTEFQALEVVHWIGAKAFAVRFAGKKQGLSIGGKGSAKAETWSSMPDPCAVIANPTC